jgi:UPF0755 protein
VTDPTRPRARGRHSQPDTLQTADDQTVRPRTGRRYAADTDATGVQVLPPRSAVDVADVGITGLEVTGIANVGLAAAGLDVSAFGIDRPATARPTGRVPGATAPRPRAAATAAAAGAAPRTAEMAVAPPAVPHLGDDRTGRGPGVAQRTAPAPRRASEPRTADRVAADRFAEAAPGRPSATGRPAPTAAAQPQGSTAGDQHAAVLGSLAALFADSPATGPLVPHPAEPADALDTEVHPALSTGELLRREQEDAAARQQLSARHRTNEPDDGADADPVHGDGWPGQQQPDGLDPVGPLTVADRTGGLEVVVPGGAGPDGHEHLDHDDEHDDEHLYEHHDYEHDYDPDEDPDDDHVAGLLGAGSGGGGRGRRGGGSGSGRRRGRRGPITVALSLVVLAALVLGIGVGGMALWRTINPTAEDYAGTGSGSVDIRVNEGDSLRAIGGTLVEADVIASADPFEDAAKADPSATGIQPGVYSLRLHMSGKAALDLLLDPASRQLTKVTVPEGLTVTQTLQRVADGSGLPLDQLQAAAADPVALGLPAYANGVLEGFLFPATYDIDPDQTAADVLGAMVARTDQVLTDLAIPVDQRLTALTKASMVQAEAGSVEDMGKVARVLENRLADGMPLQLDTTVNYANGKSGLTTTAEDRANPSPYNTYLHPGLPPGAIDNPGEEALRAVLAPTPGDWRFFVVVDPDSGDTRFAATAAEHQQNVLLFQQWLQDHPGN